MMTQTVTVFNRFGNDSPTRWSGCVLSGVHLRVGNGETLQTGGPVGGARETLLLIPRTHSYVSPGEFEALADKTGHFTLRPGDAIVPGAYEGSNQAGAENPEAGAESSEAGAENSEAGAEPSEIPGAIILTGAIRESIPDCKLITGYVEHLYGSGMDHWEVTAR